VRAVRGAVYWRRRAAALAVLIAAIVAVGIVVAGGSGPSEDRRLAPAAGNADDHYDPLAYDDDRRAEFERRAADGVSHVLYEKSPGGAAASAARTAAWRPLIDSAATPAGIDPDTVEAIVMLESAGRPDILAGDDIESAAGLSQILASTATALLGMHVDVEASRSLTKRIARAEARGLDSRAERLNKARRRADERFDPRHAIAGTVRYLTLAKKHFGRDDLAVASYHMGIGNLDGVLDRFGDHDASYAELYFSSTPLQHPLAYDRLASFGDDSSTYLWRVLAARRILELYRENPGELERVQDLQETSDSAEDLLHPGGAVNVSGDLHGLPDRPGRFGVSLPAGASVQLRPQALSALLYMGIGTRDITHGGALTVTSGQGFEFVIARRYSSRSQALAFQFMLDRMQALNLVAWRRDGERIRVVAASDVNEWLPAPATLARQASRAG
jgi:soluble lytic murein transglycosylase-like protein